jgi:hypothetical protein
VDVVSKQKILDVSSAQFLDFALADLAEEASGKVAVKRPFVVLPRLESLPAGIPRVLGIRHAANHDRWNSADGKRPVAWRPAVTLVSPPHPHLIS